MCLASCTSESECRYVDVQLIAGMLWEVMVCHWHAFSTAFCTLLLLFQSGCFYLNELHKLTVTALYWKPLKGDGHRTAVVGDW